MEMDQAHFSWHSMCSSRLLQDNDVDDISSTCLTDKLDCLRFQCHFPLRLFISVTQTYSSLSEECYGRRCLRTGVRKHRREDSGFILSRSCEVCV